MCGWPTIVRETCRAEAPSSGAKSSNRSSKKHIEKQKYHIQWQIWKIGKELGWETQSPNWKVPFPGLDPTDRKPHRDVLKQMRWNTSLVDRWTNMSRNFFLRRDNRSAPWEEQRWKWKKLFLRNIDRFSWFPVSHVCNQLLQSPCNHFGRSYISFILVLFLLTQGNVFNRIKTLPQILWQIFFGNDFFVSSSSSVLFRFLSKHINRVCARFLLDYDTCHFYRTLLILSQTK